ncbi:MAG: hypothetical protein MJZ25_13185, partial [Fibrobacter sp.]|nr:hypothetical protein [Fibrobacter sp.]
STSPIPSIFPAVSQDCRPVRSVLSGVPFEGEANYRIFVDNVKGFSQKISTFFTFFANNGIYSTFPPIYQHSVNRKVFYP